MEEGDGDSSVDKREDRADTDDEDMVLKERNDDIIHQLVENNETLKEQEHEGTEVEVLDEGDRKYARDQEVRSPNKRTTLYHEQGDNKTTDQRNLKTGLSNIVRIQ